MNTVELQSWDLKPIKYAWPGGYPVFYLCRDGWRDDETGILDFNKHDRNEFVCCADCLAKQGHDYIAVASDVNWEDTTLTCEVCSERIESAYGDDKKEAHDTPV